MVPEHDLICMYFNFRCMCFMTRFYFQNNLLKFLFIHLLCLNIYQLQVPFVYKFNTDKMSVLTNIYIVILIACLIICQWFGNQISKRQSQWRNHTNCAHNCHIQANQSNHSLTMTTTLFVCFNPYCNSRLKCFANGKGYTMHFKLSPSCFQYFCEHSGASLKAPAVSAWHRRTPHLRQQNARHCFIIIWSMTCPQQYKIRVIK
jgi:hypothetical protein